jgi:hypothetical protein
VYCLCWRVERLGYRNTLWCTRLPCRRWYLRKIRVTRRRVVVGTTLCLRRLAWPIERIVWRLFLGWQGLRVWYAGRALVVFRSGPARLGYIE